jgi:hypothetical protein
MSVTVTQVEIIQTFVKFSKLNYHLVTGVYCCVKMLSLSREMEVCGG